MKFRYFVRPRADADVDEIGDYLAKQAGLDTALKFLDEFYRTLGLLCLHPEIGWRSSVPRAGIADVRTFRVSERFEKCLIFYCIGDERIEVLRVLHGSRDLPALFDQEGIE